jgi:hypothetical protein
MTARAHYCTYFDERYLARGLALYASMRRHCQPFRLSVLCMTDQCHQQLTALGLPDIEPLRLEDLERDHPELLAAKPMRSAIEYYFTCTPALIAWLMNTRSDIETLTYLDADIFFFQRPDLLFDEFAKSSILIVPHRFSKRNAGLLKWGVYNVGWVTFRRDSAGLACLGWWHRSCLEWCHDFVDQGRFADQRYLDEFPQRFERVQIDTHPSINLAPWNLDNYRLSAGPEGEPIVDGDPVIFFHFHRLRRIAAFLWRTAHHEYGAPLDRSVRRLLYAPYLHELAQAERLVRSAEMVAPLRRDPFQMSAPIDKLRAIASIAWRGGGVWIAGNHVF